MANEQAPFAMEYPTVNVLIFAILRSAARSAHFTQVLASGSARPRTLQCEKCSLDLRVLALCLSPRNIIPNS